MMQHYSAFRRLATFGAAIVLGSVSNACSSIDGVTAPATPRIEARAVAQTAVAATFTFAAGAGAGSAISSDGAGANYTDAVCGVEARVFYAAPSYVDGNMQLDNRKAADRTCTALPGGTYPRKLTITYPDNGLTQANTGGVNVDDMGSVISGTPGLRSMGVRIAGTGARCASLGFGNAAGGSPVRVTRLSPSSWSVVSQAGGSAVCTSSKGVKTTIANFAVEFTVTLN